MGVSPAEVSCSPRCAFSVAEPVSPPKVILRHLLFGGSIAGVVATGRLSSKQMLRALGIDLKYSESTPLPVEGERGTLIVSNHTSWLDTFVFDACAPVGHLCPRHLIDFASIRRWVRRKAAVLYDRTDGSALRTAVAELAAVLRSGRSVVVFPQATTWCTAFGGEFHSAFFQAAIDAGAPIRPVTLNYSQDAVPTTVTAHPPGDTFAASIRRITRAGGVTVQVRPHPPLSPTKIPDRWSLAAAAQAAVHAGSIDQRPNCMAER